MKKSLLLLTLLLFLHTISFSQISCTNGKFYALGNAVNSTNGIYELQLNGSAVAYNGLFMAGYPGFAMNSLAIADLGNGNQFYSSINANRIVGYDGTNWYVLFTDTLPLFNAAGNGSYLYFQTTRALSYPNRIIRFDGTNETLIWSDTPTYMPIADLAVYDQGNVIFFTGSSITAPDTMRVFSPQGIQLEAYPVSFSGENAYGCFISNGTVFVAIGASGIPQQNILIPITVSGSVATVGASITMPYPVIGTTSSGQLHLAMTDAASCGSGNFSASVFEWNKPKTTVFPNPFTESFKLDYTGNSDTPFKVYNSIGKLVYWGVLSNGQNEIAVPGTTPGIYFMMIEEGNSVKTIKLSHIN